MNWMILVAGALCTFTTLGHFAVGSKQFLAPMLESEFDIVSKKVMHSVFHYVSVYLILSAIALLLAGFNIDVGSNMTLLVKFIALNYALFAIWQLVIAFTSGIPNAPFKLFQWVFFVLIALFSFLGTAGL